MKLEKQILSRISHEIRTPLNSIMGLNRIILENPKDSEQVKNAAEKISVSADYLLNLVNNILQTEQLSTKKLVVDSSIFSLKQLLENIIVTYSSVVKEHNLFFSSTIAEPFPASVVGDENKFSIVLGNLLSNAVRYNKAGGRVSFIAEHEKRGNSNFFRFTVSDTEIGFDERTYEKYIKPFRNSKTPDDEVVYGAGMGLAVAHGLVKLMGGTLHVRSVEDTGSTFWFEVPLQISDFVVPNDKEKKSALKGRCILVADDNSVNCEIVKRLLESYGCTVEITTNGKDAVSLFAASSPCHYDAILLDIRMPGMDGLEACRKYEL